MVLEKILESPLDNKEIKPIHWKDDAEAETPMLWLSDVKSQLIGKDVNAVKDQRQEENTATEDEMVGWHHQLNGRERKFQRMEVLIFHLQRKPQVSLQRALVK